MMESVKHESILRAAEPQWGCFSSIRLDVRPPALIVDIDVGKEGVLN